MPNKIGSSFVNVGDIFPTKFYGNVEVIKYENSLNITVVFENTGFTTKVRVEQIRSGSIKDRLAKTVCGVGFLGVGKYNANDFDRKVYSVWRSMLQRCYLPGDNHPTYFDCTVCEEWHNFQNFAKWFDNNYPHGSHGYELDKDIKVEGSRVYSPETCMFVTKHENLSAKSVPVTIMNGITGELFSFKSLSEAASSTGMSIAQVHRLTKERKNKCTSKGWFVVQN